MATRLDGKRFFVSGGSRGLGRAFCEHFASLGADIAFCYRHNEAAALEVSAFIESLGRRCIALQGDVTEESSVKKMVARVIEEWGGIDVLVNNAGVSQAMPFAFIEQHDWSRVIDTNLNGVYLLTRAVLQGMVRARHGSILNVGSLAGTRTIEAPVHYCATKAAVKGFTEALAKEVGRYNIQVNCIAPGLLEEGVARNLPEVQLREFLSEVALGRVGRFDEVARLAGFMVSDANSYMSGATLLIDGGF